MRNASSWDFRKKDEMRLSESFEKYGYVIEKAEMRYLKQLKKTSEQLLNSYTKQKQSKQEKSVELEKTHKSITAKEINNLRLYVMSNISKNTEFNRKYYMATKQIIHNLCGNELAMQKRVSISSNLPNNKQDILPIHADTWNGVSPYELNVWIPIVNCKGSMSLYILDRKKYKERLLRGKKLLQLTSDELYEDLKKDLTWIDIEYGKVLAFDQSLPHGYALNKEESTHWSFNCRFKGLHTPYWDKRLGEYFMPITAKCCTRIGMRYGEFSGNRIPQHIQNQIVKQYCDANKMIFVLSRAEYWMKSNGRSQLWAALNEGYKAIVFYSIWQLPIEKENRQEIYDHCKNKGVKLHFVVEKLRTSKNSSSYEEIELLMEVYLSMKQRKDQDYINRLKTLIDED